MASHGFANTIIGFRNDRMGARLLNIMHVIRLADIFKCDFKIIWHHSERHSEELRAPEELFSEAFMRDHILSVEEAGRFGEFGTDLSVLTMRNPIPHAIELLEKGGLLLLRDTFPPVGFGGRRPGELAASLSKIGFQADLQKMINGIDKRLKGMTQVSYHIRRGDIIKGPGTSEQLWPNKYVPRQYYHEHAKEILGDKNARIVVFSDEPKEIELLKAAHPKILSVEDLFSDFEPTVAQRDFLDLYIMSRSSSIIGPAGSGFSGTAAEIAGIKVQPVVDILSEEGRRRAEDAIVQALVHGDKTGLGDGDLGQTLPFAIEYLNRTARSGVAFDILEKLVARGFPKFYAANSFASQGLYCGRYAEVASINTRKSASLFSAKTPPRARDSLIAGLEGYRTLAQFALNQNKQAIKTGVLGASRSTHSRPMMSALSVAVSAHQKNKAVGWPLAYDEKLLLADTRRSQLGVMYGQVTTDLKKRYPLYFVDINILCMDWDYLVGRTRPRFFEQEQSADRTQAHFLLGVTEELGAAYYSAFSVFHRWRGDTDQAKSLASKALSEKPDNPLYAKRLSDALLKANPRDEAGLTHAKTASELSGHAEAYQIDWLHKLRLAGQVEQAREIAVNLKPDALILPWSGWVCSMILTSHGSTRRQARAMIEKSLLDIPDNGMFFNHLIGILARQKDFETALMLVDKQRRLNKSYKLSPRLAEQLRTE